MTDLPLARIVVGVLGMRCLLDGKRDTYEVAVVVREKAQWHLVPKEVWEKTKVGGTVPMEVLQ